MKNKGIVSRADVLGGGGEYCRNKYECRRKVLPKALIDLRDLVLATLAMMCTCVNTGTKGAGSVPG